MTGGGRTGASPLGRPRLHLRTIGSTNDRARALAHAGAPHGTLVSTGLQTAGRGRQGRAWVTPPDRALLLSLLLRDFDELLPLRAGLAVADLAGPAALVKWPNDVLVEGRKVAGILAEAHPQAGWAVLGTGINVALEPRDLPEGAGTLGRRPDELEAALRAFLAHLAARLNEPAAATVDAVRARDALRGRPVRWEDGAGTGAGIDASGGLRVRRPDGSVATLSAGEVHLL